MSSRTAGGVVGLARAAREARQQLVHQLAGALDRTRARAPGGAADVLDHAVGQLVDAGEQRVVAARP